MIKKLICLIIGHDYKISNTIEYVGKPTEHEYETVFCSRCLKVFKRIKT